jgi:hypothetical protein
MLATVSPWGSLIRKGAGIGRLRFAGFALEQGQGTDKERPMNRSMLAIGGAAGLALALISGPALSAEAEVCYQNVTTTEVTWNVENRVQTSEAVPASYEPLYDVDDSGDNGHYEATADGLRIWTEGTTSEDQVRLLQAVDIPLADVSSAGVNFTNTSGGGVPAAQLIIDSPSIPGLIDGTLVAEAVYGDVVWLTAGSSDALKALAPHTGVGYGSNWWGTLEEWGAAVPDATIIAIGFSLGSGVLGDGILHSVYLDDVEYPFVEETPAVPAVFEWVVVGSGQGGSLPTSDDEDVRFVQTGTVDVVTQVEVACPVDNLPPTG